MVIYIPLRSDKTLPRGEKGEARLIFISHYVQIKPARMLQKWRVQQREVYIPLRSDKTSKAVYDISPCSCLYPTRSDKTTSRSAMWSRTKKFISHYVYMAQ